MSEHEAETGANVGSVDVTEDEREPSAEPFDAEAHEQESAEHNAYLETYAPVITRLPQALADERGEETAAAEAEAEHARQMQAERDDVERRKLEAEEARRAEEAAYRDEHYPGT